MRSRMAVSQSTEPRATARGSRPPLSFLCHHRGQAPVARWSVGDGMRGGANGLGAPVSDALVRSVGLVKRALGFWALGLTLLAISRML